MKTQFSAKQLLAAMPQEAVEAAARSLAAQTKPKVGVLPRSVITRMLNLYNAGERQVVVVLGNKKSKRGDGFKVFGLEGYFGAQAAGKKTGSQAKKAAAEAKA